MSGVAYMDGICKGSYKLGTACGECRQCAIEFETLSEEERFDIILNKIEKWDIPEKGVSGLLELIQIWWSTDYGVYSLEGKKVLRLELHTGGWSDNESIIGALQRNILFFTLYWQKSTRGGHHYFKIKFNKVKTWE